MSYELDYFPPKGTKYKWLPKPLNSRPWYLTFKDFCSQNGVESFNIWPLSIHCTVDLIGGHYIWKVYVIDWEHNRQTLSGSSTTDIEAVLEAERVADEIYDKLTPEWISTALKNNWRPPFVESSCSYDIE